MSFTATPKGDLLETTVQLTEVLDYYDGPILFEACGTCGDYIGLAVESNGYAIFKVEPEPLRRFRSGSLDLLTLLVERKVSTWFTATQREDTNLFDLTEQTVPIEETGYLPESNFRYSS